MADSRDISNWLIEQIRSGRFAAGEPLPTRQALMAQFDVARATADRAIRRVIDAELAVGRKGAGTFVAGGQATRQRIFLVRPPGDLASQICAMFNDRLPYEVLDVDDVPGQFARLSRPGSRVVWFGPPEQAYYYIRSLERVGVAQILVNRRHESISFVTTDTEKGIREAVAMLREDQPNASWGVLQPPFDPSRYYWAEREIVFLQSMARAGIRPARFIRANDLMHQTVWQAARDMLAGDFPHIVFAPEQAMAVVLVTVAKERGITLGGRLTILMTDHVAALAGQVGICSLEQHWRDMSRRAADWALQRKPHPIRQFVPHTMHWHKAEGVLTHG